MDFFDLNKPCGVQRIDVGQTRGFIETENEDYKKTKKKPLKVGKEYVHKYVLREKKEFTRFCKIKASSNEGIELDNVNNCTELTSVGTYPDINALDNEQSTALYAEYFDKSEHRSNWMESKDKFTINQFKSKIVSMIELNEVIIVEGPTGCGKTTQVPQYILDSHVQKNQFCNIIVSQPRRIAAITIAKRVCEEREWPLGSICGYKVGLTDCTSKDTRLTYVTVGVLLQILLHKKHMNDYTHVILDEIHDRDQTTDFALLVVKKFLNSNSRNVKVILMSATADTTKFASYFERPLCGIFQPAPVVKIQNKTEFSVQIYYLEELSSLGKLPVINFDDPRISEQHIMIVIKLIKQFEKLDNTQTNKKSVLIFLPGIYEIEELYDKLKDPKIHISGDTEYKWFPVPLHSSITIEEQAQPFLPAPQGYRKIILATNIAESSITVPDVMFVVDFCLTKVPVTEAETNFTSLQLCWASKASLAQRGGRAGRIMDGRVYRMIYKDDYNKLDDHCTPGMLRCSLEKVVLQAKLLNIGSPKAVLALALDPPDLRNIQGTVLTLKEIGGLLPTRGGVVCATDGDLTSLGQLMADLPVDIYITRLIAMGFVYNCLEECIIIGCAMSVKSMFSNPFQSRLQSYSSKLDWADGSCSDCIAFLNVYNVWKINHATGYFRRSHCKGENNWARRHYLQLRALKEVQVLIEEIEHRLKNHCIEFPVGESRLLWDEIEKTLVLKFVIAGAFYPNYFTRGVRDGQTDGKEAVKTLCGRDPFTTVYLQNYPINQPPDLYSHLIREKMIDCKEDMKITYDHSKVFIEFREDELLKNESDIPFNGKVPGRISMAVYKAVKMRDTMKNFEIKMLPWEEAIKEADLLKRKNEEETQLQKKGETQKQGKMFLSVTPGIDVNFILLNITHVVNPGSFWATQKDVITKKQGRDLFKWLNSPKANLEVFLTLPEVGTMCAAPYQVENNFWFYRARIDKLYTDTDQNLAKVFFIDFGNSEIVSVRDLRKYGPKLLKAIGKIAAQAFPCILTKIRPSQRKNPGGQWCESAKKKFYEIVKKGELIGSIYSVVNGTISLVLYKIIQQGSKQLEYNINQILVNEGFAEVCEESYLSKQDNEIRTKRQLDCYQESYNTTQTKEIWTRPPPIDFITTETDRIPVKLRGPFSPLEMKLFCCIQGGASKLIKISPSSVNSVLLDSDPQDPHERLVVAGQVGQNQTGTSLLLHNTTVMPNIRGLAALVPFVFAPTVEIRVNKKRTMYTGLLCGLGVDDCDRPIYPEHDMEVVFDCEFTPEDYITVNQLRFLMSDILKRGCSNPDRSYKDLILFQTKIKECFMKLIDKSRPSKELEFPDKPFEWKLVKTDIIINNEEIKRSNHMSIFPMLPGVSIKSLVDEKKRLLKNLTDLCSLANSREKSSESIIVCEICDLELINQNFLRLHLASESHKEKETKFRSTVTGL